MNSSSGVAESAAIYPATYPLSTRAIDPAMSRRVGLLAAPAIRVEIMVALTVALGAAPGAACSKSEVKSTAAAGDPAPPRPAFTLFAVAEVRGQIGPCGCTTDPLGDLSRTAQLVVQARAAGPVLFV